MNGVLYVIEQLGDALARANQEIARLNAALEQATNPPAPDRGEP